MRTAKTILLVFLFSAIFVDALPNLKKDLKKKKVTFSKPKLVQRKTSEKPKEYYDDLVEKGLIADNLTRGNPPSPAYEPIDYKKDRIKRKNILKSFEKKKNRRKLFETQTLSDLGFIDIMKNSSNALRFVMNNVKKEESKFILYPYPFSYKDKDENTTNVENGGFFHLNQSQLTNQKFTYIQNISSAIIGKAKGIYDIDVAIMSLIYQYKGNEMDLFTEASTYCEYFVNTLNKLSSCTVGKKGYLEYKNNYPTRGAVVRISHEDLLNDILFDPQTGQLNFKLLIFSDYLNDNEQTIFDKYLKKEQIDIIKRYRDLGGHIIASGKSGYLLEKMGFIPENTYDTSFAINTKNTWKDSANVNPTAGCSDIYKSNPDEQEDFLKELICLGYLDRGFLVKAFTMNTIPDNFESLIKYTNQHQFLHKLKDGYENQIVDKEQTYDYILLSKEDSKKGRILIVNGNTIQNTYYFNEVRNFILYAMSRNLIYDLKISFNPTNSQSYLEEDLPIPGGEEGVQLITSFKILNLDVNDINDVEINILFANDVEYIKIDEECSLIENDNKYITLNATSINNKKYLKCSINNLQKLNKYEQKFKLEITKYDVTARLYDIPLMYSKITYKEDGKQQENCPGIFYAQAQAAALLRGTINKDPTSYYPMNGWGLYFDLVLAVENKENSIAKDVNYISLVPLVSPLTDGEDEGSVAKLIPLYEKYYEKHGYTYPWKSTENRGTDYIDYAEVSGKGVCYVDDYDMPVKLKKVSRDDLNSNNISQLYTPTVDDKLDEYVDSRKASNVNNLLKQVYFGDNEYFYETAAARTSLFINTATKEGADAAYEGTGIPEDLKDPNHPDRTKVQYCFIRVDTFFYNSEHEMYQLPNGFDEKILISIDAFDQSGYPPQENKQFGDIKKQVVNQGHYDSTRNFGDRLKVNEWANSLRQYAYLKQYDPTDPVQLSQLQEKTTDKIRLSHFMIPFVDKGIEKANSIYGFKLNSDTDDGSGYLEEYPSVKFIYGHSIYLELKPEDTRLGGKVEILLGETRFKTGDNIIENERITTSADNVAFYKTEYISGENKIILYFKRGLMPNENYGPPSKCKVFLENIDKRDNFTVTLKLYDLKYDFSEENLESLIFVSEKEETAEYKPFFSLPCLYIENTLRRKSSFQEEYSNEMYEYELMNTYARYGGYYQELTKHASVYGSAESHHVTNPGFQSTSGGFSLIGNIGTSSIPFAEFLQHGKLAVPGVVSTSRLEWTDIWGRRWAQNLRSVYPDIPPIPPVPLSFIMTTTYELITNDLKQERLLEWQSDESVYIRVQMKIKNTYKLYWEPTICFENQKPFIKEKVNDYRNPTFLPPEENLSGVKDEHDVNLGFSSVYGVCYNEGSYIQGVRINKEISDRMKEMMSCAADVDATKMTECANRLKGLGLPIVKRKPDDGQEVQEKQWNYSPLIEDYLPDGYIHSDLMWQLTMESDYWDDSFYKGYPWHLDDCIPNLDNGNIKPHDLIAFPIYKGLGYSITYDNQYSLKKFPKYKGWWSDQLQNKDHTLIAGQQKVNQISVGKESLLKDSDWINAKKLKYTPKEDNLALKRLKNIYVCQFNQHRVKVTPYQKKYSFLKNVYQNNVIPVIPDLDENDPRYHNFDCSGENGYQYTPYNISQVDNRVYTNNDRDWLYFAAGLRSNAKENINVILKLNPIDGTFFEGITKIQDGGRFTYWQPPDGPNSYQYYDGNVNTVISKRVDLTMTHKLLPTELLTFNFNAYQLFTIEDKKEENREYTMNIYTNSHGYGDSTVTIYVGGVESTKCKVEPGQFTFVKIVFYNNAGFDWIMKDNAIIYEDTGKTAKLNGMSVMMDINTAIQHPRKYNFMEPIIPDEIKNYVTLTPSEHVSDVSPQFYDLTFNNVLNIKDALEGDYFYCLNISDTFPNEYKGKLWEIKMVLNEEYFEMLPNHNDPTDIHDYHLTIPSIRFGVPISEEGEYKGKVFYNLGQAHDLSFTYQIYKDFIVKGIKVVTENDINYLLDATQDKEMAANKLKEKWESLNNAPEIENLIEITNKTINDFYQEITVNLSKAYPLFPYEKEQRPFISKISFLVKTYSDYIPYGYKNHLIRSKVYYNDSRKIKKNDAEYPLYINVYAKGPSIRPEFSTKVVEYNETTSSYIELDDQTIHEGDTRLIKLTLKATNEGTGDVFSPIFNLGINPDAIYKPQDNQNSINYEDKGIFENSRKIVITYDGTISSNEDKKFDLYFEMKFGELIINNLRNLEANEQENIELVKSLDITLCLTNAECQEGSENFGKQKTDKTYKIKFEKEKKIITDDKPLDNKEIEEKDLNQEEKDLNQEEKEETKDEAEQGGNTKIYLIIIIIIVGILVLLGVGFLIYKFIFLKKKNRVEEEIIEDDDIIKKRPAKNQTLPQSTKRSIKNIRHTNIIPFQN